jgi:methyl-accepting chemotaxis protein
MPENKKQKKISLRTRFLLSTLPAIIILLLANNFITEYLSRAQILNLVNQNLLTTSSQAARIFDLVFVQIDNDIENLSEFPLIFDYFHMKGLSQNEESDQTLIELKKYINKFIKKNKLYVSAVVIDNEGNIILDESLPDRPFTSVFPDFLFGVQDERTSEILNRIIHLPISYYPEYNLKIETITFPLINESGTHVGSFILNVDWSEVEKQISGFEVGEKGYIFVTEINTQTVVSFPPDPNKELQLTLNSLQFSENPLYHDQSLAKDTWNNTTSFVYSTKTKNNRFLISASIPESEAFSLVNKLRIINIFIVSLVIILAVIIIWFIAHSISKKISSLVTAFQAVSQGDLKFTVTEKSQDETQDLADYFNAMTMSLSKLVDRVRISCKDVQSASQNIEESSQEVDVTFRDFETFSIQISQSVVQISANLQKLSHDVQKVSHAVDEATRMARDGRKAVNELEKKVEQVNTSFTGISSKLMNINQQTSNITEILQVMTGIADRTNLLSLNASLEAVHAGEYGKGFAVVAQEIRYLSDRVSVSAEDIEHVITNMEKAVYYGVEAMNSFATELNADVNDIRKIGSQLSGLIRLVETLGPSFSLLSTGVEEQTNAAKKIDHLLAQMNSKAKGTASALEISGISVKLLTRSTEELQEEISRFDYRA